MVVVVKCVWHQQGAGRPWRSSVEALSLPSSCREAFLSTVRMLCRALRRMLCRWLLSCVPVWLRPRAA